MVFWCSESSWKQPEAIQKTMETMKLNSCGTLICRWDYASANGSAPASEVLQGVDSKEDLVVKIQLLQIYEFEAWKIQRRFLWTKIPMDWSLEQTKTQERQQVQNINEPRRSQE